MNIKARLHRFIVWDFQSGPPSASRFSFFIGLVPLAVFVLVDRPLDGGDITLIVAGLVLSIAWFGFVAWRLARAAKANAVKADRKYDREGKFDLSPEYEATESATRAVRRLRRERGPDQPSGG